MINCYAFGSVPPFAQGLVRDLPVRWALEEAGLPYRVTLLGEGPGTMSPSAYRSIQPFGRILRHTDLLEREPVLVAYEERCEARPAFTKALGGQMAAFAA